ncbi:MAG TPA: peptidoglycan-binding protein [Candidatus Binataceae bacterium]|nr:peptidoglycan-binding protein [Candidatus Binataceae bacterium]
MADRELRIGDIGNDVKLAQDLLNRIGMLLDDDGHFGAATQSAVRDAQQLGELKVTGQIDFATWTWLRAQPEPSPDIATKAVTFIAKEEVGNRAYYESHAAHPSFPGGKSGVTIGVGYDLRFQTRDGFTGDWKRVLSREQLDALLPFVGRQGSAEIVRELMTIVVPWREAWTVFIQRLLPTYVSRTRAAFLGFDRLNSLLRGVLVSLVYNRGTKMEGNDRREMREIRDAVQAGNLDVIPQAISSMKRLWPNSEGLRLRRVREAELFREGLLNGN